MSITFRLSYSVNDKLLKDMVNPPVEFDPEEPAGISVAFSSRAATIDRMLIVSATTSRDVPSVLANEFREVSEGRLPKGSMTKAAGPALAEGNLLKPDHVAPLEALPHDFQRICDQIQDDLFDSVRRKVDLVRWRGGLSYGKQHNLLGHVAFEFSLDDGQAWKPVPHRLHAAIRAEFPVLKGGLSQEIFDDVSRFSSTAKEPVSRQLFREAWGVRQNNPGAALVIGFAAVELGCKEFIQDAVPMASWLAVEAPSPPVDRILKSYIPTLPSRSQRGGTAAIPDAHAKLIQKAMNARNKLAHRGELSLFADELENVLRAINDLLWLLNYHAGYEWALEYVSSEGRSQLDMTSQK